MARPLRLEFPGALYHVTARGNERRSIVLDDVDRARWVEALARVVARFAWCIHAFCLMDNHHHLLVETPRPNLSRGMRELNGVYAQAFNYRHRRSGHLFGGRFHSVLVEREPHLLELCRYVVLNPVRAGLPVDRLDRFRWSSYRATAGLDPAPGFLSVDSVLSQFARSRGRSTRAYRTFVRDGVGVDPWEDLRSGIYLGSDQFVRRHQPDSVIDPEVPVVQQAPIRCSLSELLARERDRAVLVAYREHGFRLREIATQLGVHYATVSRRLCELEQAERRG